MPPRKTRHYPTRAKLDAHVKLRARERLGITISRSDIRQAITSIKHGDAELIAKGGNRPIYRVKFKHHTALVVYDRQRDALVTVLPKNHNAAKRTPTATLKDVMPDELLKED